MAGSKTPFGGGGPIHEFGAGTASGLLDSNGNVYSIGAFIEEGYIKIEDGRLVAVLAASPEPWFEWNGTDLSQFDAEVVGSNVTAHDESFVTYRGFNWIRMTTTSSGGTTAESGVVLPISTQPPNSNYVIAFDFISINTSSNVVGAGAVVRFVSMSQAYYIGYVNRVVPPIHDFGRLDAGETITRFQNMDDPRLSGINRGCRMALSVSGGSDGVIAKMIVGEPAIYADDSPHNDGGKAGLFNSTRGVSGPCENYYRAIRCYDASVVESFEL